VIVGEELDRGDVIVRDLESREQRAVPLETAPGLLNPRA
jgi:hypothetical protein